MAEVIESGLSEEDIVRRNAIATTVSYKIREQSAQLDVFVEDTSAKIRSRGEELINYVNKLKEEKSEALRTACEAAQAELNKLLRDLEGTSNDEVNRGAILLDNVLSRNLRINDIKLAEYSYSEADVTESLANFAKATVVFPSDELLELQLDEDAKLRAEEARKQAELEERLKVEKKLQRFSGIYGSWNVSAVNKVEVTTFKVDKDIFLTGIGVGNAYNPGSTTAVEELEIIKGASTRGEIVVKLLTPLESTYSGDAENQFFKVPFETPGKIVAGEDYTIRLRYRRGPNVWAAGQTVTNSVEGYNFTFKKSVCAGGDQDNNGNATTAGPTRDLYFA